MKDIVYSCGCIYEAHAHIRPLPTIYIVKLCHQHADEYLESGLSNIEEDAEIQKIQLQTQYKQWIKLNKEEK